MLFDDTYHTIITSSEGVFRDKGSKFIGYAYPISSEEEAKSRINTLKALHPKARHFCWALRLTPDRSVFKLNDDGEPSGTAGRPILNCLLSLDVTNILVVVVRYFGGTLLGVPGLISAYKNATLEAMNANQIVEQTIKDVYEAEFDYLQMNAVMSIVKSDQLTIFDQDFAESCRLKFAVRKTNLSVVLGKLEKIDGIKLKYLHTI